MKSRRFSLILPCLSDPATVRRTLTGISAQAFDAKRVQVVVVDDCSNPPLEPVVCKFQASSGIETVYLRNQKNQGRAASRNRGISAAEGEILVFMDSDQLLEPGFLTYMDKGFGKRPAQSIRANTSVWPPLLSKSAFLRYYDTRFLGSRVSQIGLTGLPPKYYATTCIATGRHAVEEVGGFDESFRNYGCEDEELGTRLHKAGVPLSLSLEAKSYSTDEGLTVRRACTRLVDYASASLPILLRKHPDYSSQLALEFLEPSSTASKRAMRLAALLLYRPSIAQMLVRYLEVHDSKENFQPSPRLYQLAMLGFYVQGVRSRMGPRT